MIGRKGYMVTPLVFIMIFVLVASFSFYASSSDRSIARSIAEEGKIKKLLGDMEEELNKMSLLSFETLYTNYKINNRTVMESTIKNMIQSAFGGNVLVSLLNTSSESTRLVLYFNSYTKVKNGMILSLNNTSYKTVLGYPFANYTYFYESYDTQTPVKVCAYVSKTGGGCVFDSKNYGANMSALTGFVWEVSTLSCVTDSKTGIATVSFKIEIYDKNNMATQVLVGSKYNHFKLDNRKIPGSYSFTVQC